MAKWLSVHNSGGMFVITLIISGSHHPGLSGNFRIKLLSPSQYFATSIILQKDYNVKGGKGILPPNTGQVDDFAPALIMHVFQKLASLQTLETHAHYPHKMIDLFSYRFSAEYLFLLNKYRRQNFQAPHFIQKGEKLYIPNNLPTPLPKEKCLIFKL